MVDYDEKNTNLNAAFEDMFDGVPCLQHAKRSQVCSNAINTDLALKNYELAEKHSSALSQQKSELFFGFAV